MGHADFEAVAFVAHVFLSDSRGHRLHAFKPASGIEERALLAGMQFEAALRTLPVGRETLQHGAALSAARHGPGPR